MPTDTEIKTHIDNMSNLPNQEFDGDKHTTIYAEDLQYILRARELLYPIGSIYINADDDTNPSTLFGFGTWVAFGEGRVLVGIQDAGTFDVAGETGGEETHTLTTSEIPAHNHTGTANSSGSHTHGVTGSFVTTSGGSQMNFASGGFTRAHIPNTDAGGAHTHTLTINDTGGNSSHNNLQPYVVVYMWRRTA